jgi:hypothetical protein
MGGDKCLLLVSSEVEQIRNKVKITSVLGTVGTVGRVGRDCYVRKGLIVRVKIRDSWLTTYLPGEVRGPSRKPGSDGSRREAIGKVICLFGENGCGFLRIKNSTALRGVKPCKPAARKASCNGCRELTRWLSYDV